MLLRLGQPPLDPSCRNLALKRQRLFGLSKKTWIIGVGSPMQQLQAEGVNPRVRPEFRPSRPGSGSGARKGQLRAVQRQTPLRGAPGPPNPSQAGQMYRQSNHKTEDIFPWTTQRPHVFWPYYIVVFGNIWHVAAYNIDTIIFRSFLWPDWACARR